MAKHLITKRIIHCTRNQIYLTTEMGKLCNKMYKVAFNDLGNVQIR